MKKIFIIFLILSLLCSSALSDGIDLSGMSFDDLVALREQINLAIWNCQEWQEVEVPIGVWEIGKDIPAGYWHITLIDNEYANITYTDSLDDTGHNVAPGWHGYNETLSTRKNKDGSWKYPGEPSSIDLEMVEGMYFINSSPAIFTPYTGKPDLGFK